MGKVGRKPKYTPVTVNKIVKYLKQGNSMERSAILSGINPSTLFAWLNQYSELKDDLEKAKEYNIATRLKRISKHAKTNWQADAWVLERTRPQEFALKTVSETYSKQDTTLIFKIVADKPKALEEIKEVKEIDSNNGE